MLKTLFADKTDAPAIHLLRSIQASLAACLLDFGVLILLVEHFHAHYLPAASISYIAGVSLSYLLSINWIFATRTISRRYVEFSIYAGIGAGGLLCTAALMRLIVECLQQHYLIAKCVSGSTVFLVSFAARRTVLFSKRPGTHGREERAEEPFPPACNDYE